MSSKNWISDLNHLLTFPHNVELNRAAGWDFPHVLHPHPPRIETYSNYSTILELYRV